MAMGKGSSVFVYVNNNRRRKHGWGNGWGHGWGHGCGCK